MLERKTEEMSKICRLGKVWADLPTNGEHPVKGVQSPWEVHP